MDYEELIKNTALGDDRIVVMTAENRALIRNLPNVLKDRFIDTGITEQCLIGTASGLALRNRIPIVHALAAFLTMRAFEFIRTDIGVGNLQVKLSGFIPGFLSDGNGPAHQALEDVSLMRGIPGMQVFCPADEEDMLIALPHIWSSVQPAYVRINTRKSIFRHNPHFETGKAEVVCTGKDITIMVYGMLFEEALKASRLLEKEGLSVGLINLRSLKPIDENALLEAQKNSELLVTIEDHFFTGGLYSILAELFLSREITARVLPFSLKEKWFRPGLLQDVLQHEGFTAEQIAKKIINELHKKHQNRIEHE